MPKTTTNSAKAPSTKADNWLYGVIFKRFIGIYGEKWIKTQEALEATLGEIKLALEPFDMNEELANRVVNYCFDQRKKADGSFNEWAPSVFELREIVRRLKQQDQPKVSIEEIFEKEYQKRWAEYQAAVGIKNTESRLGA